LKLTARNWRRPQVVGAGIALAASLVLGACQSSTTGNTSTSCSGTQPTIYMIGSTTNSTFWQALESGFVQGASDFCVKGIYSAPTAHTNTDEIALISAALAAKPGGMAINYVDHSIYNSTVQALGEGVKVVLFNNNRFEPVNGDPATATTDPQVTSLAYVGQDEHQSGITLANAFLSAIPTGKSVLWYPVVPEVQVITLRGNGVYSVLDAHNIKHEFLQAPGAPGQEGLDEASDETTVCAYLKAHPEIGAVVGTSVTSPATAKCAQQLGISLPIAEFDVDLESANFLQAGQITVAVDQQPFWQGYLAVENLAYELKYKIAPVNVNTGTLLVTKSNAADVIYAIQHQKD